ncbi:hypothetical protein QQF64_020010 [Cirrhinus molitorella]|uniref:Reverse transcriptase zinc-binding domain-containing protein n=1 Tax=Cirrhinus molitorella TaxID=172907 RepID=A0ABR3LH36_9TELE
MIVDEVKHQEEGTRRAKVVSLSIQGQWTRWDSVEKRKLSWKDLWSMESKRLSFIIRATYDVLPTPVNLQQWRGEDPSCALCSKPASLKHILTGCKVSLTQGRYTWCHNQVLKSLAATKEHRRTAANTKTPSVSNPLPAVTFVREGARKNQSRFVTSEYSQLRTACDWKMLVDVGQRLAFPQEIATTTLRRAKTTLTWSSGPHL